MSQQEESQSTPALIHMPEAVDLTSSLGMIPENTLLESYTRLSVSLEENGLFQVPYHLNAYKKNRALAASQQLQRTDLMLQASSRSSSNGSSHHSKRGAAGMTLEELRAVNRYAESTKSLSYLPQVKHEQ